MNPSRCTAGLGIILGLAALPAAAADQAAPAGGDQQQLLRFDVLVVDPDGQPAPGARVVPWALRSSLGHGHWRPEDDTTSQPPESTTDDDGRAEVSYPRYARVAERVRPTQVTLSVDHPEYAYISHHNVDVTTPPAKAVVIELQRGAPVEIVPLENGRPAETEGLHVVWSDERFFAGASRVTAGAGGTLRVPPMEAGERAALVVRLDDKQRATHFSPVIRLRLTDGVAKRVEAELRPSVLVRGRFSDNVPRPVRNGRVKLDRLGQDGDDVWWFTWTPVAEDGTFTAEWPAGEAVQVIALCDGYLGESGAAPEGVPDVERSDLFTMPQVFTAEQLVKNHEIVVRMERMARCQVDVVNEAGEPVEGARVLSNPNVLWWNGGSQIYGTPLVRMEQVLDDLSYEAAAETPYPAPFQATTDAEGHCEFDLPAGRFGLGVRHDRYELPILANRREVEVDLEPGEENFFVLVVREKGSEFLGELAPAVK